MQGVESRRRIAICMSARPSSYEKFLNNLIPCQAIYSKDFEHGTLYGLHLKGPKSDAVLDKRITFLDGMLADCSPDKSTRFTSICNTPSLSGKIKTFAQGTHGEDMHFKALFSSDYAGRRGLDALQGVKKWTHSDPGNESQQLQEEDYSDVTDTNNGGSSQRKERTAATTATAFQASSSADSTNNQVQRH
jgi:hypothetical protein